MEVTYREGEEVRQVYCDKIEGFGDCIIMWGIPEIQRKVIRCQQLVAVQQATMPASLVSVSSPSQQLVAVQQATTHRGHLHA